MLYRKLSTATIIPITISLMISQANAFSTISDNGTVSGNFNTSFNIQDQNVQDTSILISQNTFEKSENVVMISRNNTIDSFPATTLASCLDAPILLLDDNIQDSTIDEISRLKVKNVYIIGEIDSRVITDLKNTLNLNVTQICGENRYETSQLIAIEVKKRTPIKEVFILEENSQIDAITLSSISAKHKIPILYNSKDSLNDEVEHFLKTNKLEKVYLIGNSFTQEIFDTVKNIYYNTELINGKDRYEINTTLNIKFFSKAEGVIFIDKNNLVDAAPIAVTAAKYNSSILLVHNKLTDSQSKYLNSLNITNLNNVGTVNKYPLLSTLNSLHGVNTKNIFNKGQVVFYIPHQYDETTLFSSTILNAINTLGKENVHICLITDGDQLVENDEIKEEITSIAKSRNISFSTQGELNNISSKLISEARDNEFLEAIKNIGIPLSNVKLINGISSDKCNDAIDYIKSTIYEYNNLFNGDITHITTSPYYSSNSDHIAIGNVLEELYIDRVIDNAYFTFDTTISKQPKNFNIIKFTTTDINELNKIRAALNSYKKWDPYNLRLSIGYNIDKESLDALDKSIANKYVENRIHIPTT